MGIAALTPPQFNRMETTMTKSKITAVALTALTLAGSLAATSGSAQAHSHWGTGVGTVLLPARCSGPPLFPTPTLPQFM
jgi:hypothetical protein